MCCHIICWLSFQLFSLSFFFFLITLLPITGQGNRIFICLQPLSLISCCIDLFGKWQMAIRSSQLRLPRTHFSFVQLEKSDCSFLCVLYLFKLTSITAKSSWDMYPNEAPTCHIQHIQAYQQTTMGVLIKGTNYKCV